MNLFERIKRKQQAGRFEKQLLETEVIEAIIRFAQQAAGLKEGCGLQIRLAEGESLYGAGGRNVQAPYYLQIFSDGSSEGCLNAGYTAGQTAAYLRFRGISAAIPDIVPEWLQSKPADPLQCSVVLAFGKGSLKEKNNSRDLQQELPCIRIDNEQAWSGEILDFIKKQGMVRPEYTHMVFRNGSIHFLLKTTARRHPQQAAVDAGIQIANVMAAADELWIDLETVKQKEITEAGYLLSVRHKDIHHSAAPQIRYA